MNINPFIVSGKIPAELYCDRNQETANLLKFLQSQENVVLMSQRRMGKTKLVEHCSEANELDKQYILMYADILHTTSLREFIQLLGGVVFDSVARRSAKMMKLFTATVKSLRGSFGYDPILNTPTFDIRLGDITAPEYTLKEIFECIEKADRRCIIVIDEFQQVTKYSEKDVEALLRSHIQNVSNANFVFAGSQRRLMEEMFFSESRPFYMNARSIQLAPIPFSDYYQFASHHFKQAGKSIDEEAVKYVYDTFLGVTLYLQRMMKDAYNLTASGDSCDIAAIKQIINDYVLECEPRLREQLAFVTETQKELLYAVSEEPEPVNNLTSSSFIKHHRLKSSSAVQAAARKLLEYDLLTRNEGTYSIADPLMALWLHSKRF
jgi:AAA+ ATPase superfamily predicted ATPase